MWGFDVIVSGAVSNTFPIFDDPPIRTRTIRGVLTHVDVRFDAVGGTGVGGVASATLFTVVGMDERSTSRHILGCSLERICCARVWWARLLLGC